MHSSVTLYGHWRAGLTPRNAPSRRDRLADVRGPEGPQLVTCRVCLGKMERQDGDGGTNGVGEGVGKKRENKLGRRKGGGVNGGGLEKDRS